VYRSSTSYIDENYVLKIIFVGLRNAEKEAHRALKRQQTPGREVYFTVMPVSPSDHAGVKTFAIAYIWPHLP
jgi:hypothetical protein